MRVDKANYYLDIAEVVLERSTCIRRHFGVVIVNNDIVISTGYNGNLRGEPNCCDTNYCLRNEMNIKSGEGYEHCVAVHAEQNALLNISLNDAIGSSLYLVGIDVATGNYFPVEPCHICSKLIKVMGIKKIYLRESKTSFKIIE
jgi:dCMP deaminase